MISQSWGRSFFKGRIGEGIVESVLAEFGYEVLRTGQEYRRKEEGNITQREPFTPDFAVTDPRTQVTTLVEVKYRAARPMSVLWDGVRLEEIRHRYPGTVLVSAYDGSVNCREHVSESRAG